MNAPHGDILFGSEAWRCLTVILIFSLPHGNDQFFCASWGYQFFLFLTAMINFFGASWGYQFFFASRQWSFFFVPHGDIDFFFTSQQWSIFFFASRRLFPPCRRFQIGQSSSSAAPLVFWQAIIDTHSPWITATPPQEHLCLLLWLQAQCLKSSYSRQNVAMLWLDWQKLKAASFNHAIVVFLMTPGHEQPLHPFWCSLTRMTGHPLASDDPIKNSIYTLISKGCLLSWYIMDIRNQPTELALSKSFLIRGLTFMALIQAIILHSSTSTSHFKLAFNKFEDPIQESSQDWPIVLLETLRVMPGQHNSLVFLLASTYMTSIPVLLSLFYSGSTLLASALGESIGTLFGWWDEPYVQHSYFVGIEHFVFRCFFLVWYLCARGFIQPCFVRKPLNLPLPWGVVHA
jgi:hypothetical protein